MAEASVSSRHLAEAIENAILFSKEKYPVNTSIELSITDGHVVACGFTRWSAIIDRRPVQKNEGEGSIILDYLEAETFLKDVLKKVKGFSGKGSVTHLRLNSDSVGFYDSEETVGSLGRSGDADKYEGDEDHLGFYEHLYDLEAEVSGELRSMTLVREIFARLNKIKMSTFEDDKWVTAQEYDTLDFHALLDSVVGIQYGSASILQVTAGVVELEEE
jgi:hypothetical protein